MKTLLVACSGLGLGNSTRLLGVVQAIRSGFGVRPEELRIVVFTSGRAVRFWEAEGRAVQTELAALEPYLPEASRGASKIEWLSFLRPAAAGAYLRNCRMIYSFCGRNAVDLALIDSDYHFPPFLCRGIPIFALGQARDVLRRYLRYGARNRVPLASMLIELLDYTYQRLVSERTLVPCFDPASRPGAATVDVPLIVRREFEIGAAAGGSPASPAHVLLGGSGIGAAALLAYARAHSLPVIGEQGEVSALDGGGLPRIDRSAFVIAQGGLSSISECVSRRKPMLLLPISGHAEQRINALEIQRRGAGACAEELSDPPDRLKERLMTVGSVPERPHRWPAVGGASVVARMLLERLGLRPQAAEGGRDDA